MSSSHCNRRHRHAQKIHLREARSLPSEQILHPAITIGLSIAEAKYALRHNIRFYKLSLIPNPKTENPCSCSMPLRPHRRKRIISPPCSPQCPQKALIENRLTTSLLLQPAPHSISRSDRRTNRKKHHQSTTDSTRVGNAILTNRSISPSPPIRNLTLLAGRCYPLNISEARRTPSTSNRTSSNVLYMANEARTVPVIP